MGGYVGAGQKPIALFDAYTKGQADGLFPDKTSVTPQDFTAMPSVGGDPVVESGSNADGEWTRFADGTQVNTQKQDGNFGVGTPGWAWAFPVSFSQLPVFSGTYIGGASGSVYLGLEGISGTVAAGFIFNDSGSSKVCVLSLIAIGRWK